MSTHSPQIRYSRPFRSDLVEVLDYTEREWGEAQRSAYWQLIRTAIVTVSESPGIGRSRDELSAGLRSYPVGTHFLFYWQTETSIDIARILHSRRDPARVNWSLNWGPYDDPADQP